MNDDGYDLAAFGDDEPEDAWDPDDAPRELIANLIRRAALGGMTIRQPRDGADPADVLRALTQAADRVDRAGFADDVAVLAARLGFAD